MAVRAGRLDRRITLQRKVRGPSPTGQLVESWVDLEHRPWAEVTWEDGTEGYRTDQRTGPHQVTFEIRYRAGISAADTRVAFDGEIFAVLSVSEGDRRQTLLLRCRAREPRSGA